MEELIQPEYRAALAADRRKFAHDIQRRLDEVGIATLPNFFTPAALQRMRDEVQAKYEICLGGPTLKPLYAEELAGTSFHEMAKSDFVQDVCNVILESFGYKIEKPDVYPVLNVLEGPKGLRNVNVFHFDATFITLAVPVVMPGPDATLRGPFRIWPNVRAFSTSWLKNKFFWRIMRLPRLRDRFRQLSVDFVPGNLYFFYGFRSWHGIGEFDGAQLRANCLINAGGPFFDRDKKAAGVYK